MACVGRLSTLMLAGAVALGCLWPSDARAGDPDPWIARDKAFHFDVSAGIAAAAYGISAGWIVDARWKALAIGGGVTLGAGAAKELLDLAGLGDPSWKDLAWDAAGTVAGLAIAWGIDLALGGVSDRRPLLGAPVASTQSALTPSRAAIEGPAGAASSERASAWGGRRPSAPLAVGPIGFAVRF